MLPTEDVFVYVHAMAGDAIKAGPSSSRRGPNRRRVINTRDADVLWTWGPEGGSPQSRENSVISYASTYVTIHGCPWVFAVIVTQPPGHQRRIPRSSASAPLSRCLGKPTAWASEG